METEETQGLEKLPVFGQQEQEESPPNGADSTSEEATETQPATDPNQEILDRLKALEERERKQAEEIQYWRGRAEQASSQQYDTEALPNSEREWTHLSNAATMADHTFAAIVKGVQDDDIETANEAIKAWNQYKGQMGSARQVWDKRHKSQAAQVKAARENLVKNLTQSAKLSEDDDDYRAAIAMQEGGAPDDLIEKVIMARHLEAQANQTAQEQTSAAAAQAAGGLETEISSGGIGNPEGQQQEEQGPIKPLGVQPPMPTGAPSGDFADNFGEGSVPDYLK